MNDNDERDSKCFVPKCNRSVGVLFPKNAEVKNKWLRQLGLNHCKPNAKSFVCLKHFGSDGQPSINNPKNLPQSSSILVKKGLSNESPQQSIDAKKLDVLKRLAKPHGRSLRVNHENVGSESDEVPDTYRRGRKCRLCLTHSLKLMNHVFDLLTESTTIAQAVTICLVPLQISANDKLSKHVCLDCTNLLRSYYRFHVKCFENDQKQRLDSKKMPQHKSGNDADNENSDEYVHEEGLSDDSNKKNKKNSKLNYSPNKPGKKAQTNEDLIKVLEGNDEVILTKVKKPPPPSSHDEASVDEESQYESINEEGDGDEGTEDIFIEMIEDSDPPPESPPPPVDLPKTITIKRVENGAKKPEKRKISEKGGSENENKKPRNEGYLVSRKDPMVVLPGGNIWEGKYGNTHNNYTSPLGIYQACLVNYLLNSTFLLAGNYLYKLGLRMNNLRRLTCLKFQCPAEAVQKSLANNSEYAPKISVLVGHNHPEPDETERKIEMFYYLLYSNMKRQKHFNFKTHYDEMCQLDPVLLKLVPIREVVKEICRQGPIHNTPKIHTFNDLFALIEKDSFHRLQFNNESIQFYQAKFETDDGSKGLLFANKETIKRYSDCKVMYVDATFLIKTQEFPINLVTVLVLHNNNYVPVCFAVVNKHSQELYRKIFSYVYDSLAPKLRPEEIVTEYEANLYYALGETYNTDSIIGGSLFSYAQNIYKHISSLNLARVLELNSCFRNIFDLLLILPLLPVNSISDALSDIEDQTKNLDLPQSKIQDLFKHVRQEWIEKVNVELFCVHRLENRISENLCPAFKKLRDFIVHTMNAKKTMTITIESAISKLMELDKVYSKSYEIPRLEHKTHSLQRRLVLSTWDFVETSSGSSVNECLKKLVPFVRSMENQLWIWGLYRFESGTKEMLIDRKNFIMDQSLNEPEETDQINDEINLKAEVEEVMELQEEVDEEMEPQEEVEEEMEPQEEVEEVEPKDEADEQREQGEAEIVEEYYLEEEGEVTNPDKSNSQLLAELADEIEEEVEENVKEHQDLEEDAGLVELFEDSNGACYIMENGEKKFVSQVEGDDSYVYQ